MSRRSSHLVSDMPMAGLACDQMAPNIAHSVRRMAKVTVTECNGTSSVHANSVKAVHLTADPNNDNRMIDLYVSLPFLCLLIRTLLEPVCIHRDTMNELTTYRSLWEKMVIKYLVTVILGTVSVISAWNLIPWAAPISNKGLFKSLSNSWSTIKVITS
jgi:hypothetical protein